MSEMRSQDFAILETDHFPPAAEQNRTATSLKKLIDKRKLKEVKRDDFIERELERIAEQKK